MVVSSVDGVAGISTTTKVLSSSLNTHLSLDSWLWLSSQTLHSELRAYTIQGQSQDSRWVRRSFSGSLSVFSQISHDPQFLGLLVSISSLLAFQSHLCGAVVNAPVGPPPHILSESVDAELQ